MEALPGGTCVCVCVCLCGERERMRLKYTHTHARARARILTCKQLLRQVLQKLKEMQTTFEDICKSTEAYVRLAPYTHTCINHSLSLSPQQVPEGQGPEAAWQGGARGDAHLPCRHARVHPAKAGRARSTLAFHHSLYICIWGMYACMKAYMGY
jgi:hypothetical protein